MLVPNQLMHNNDVFFICSIRSTDAKLNKSSLAEVSVRGKRSSARVSDCDWIQNSDQKTKLSLN